MNDSQRDFLTRATTEAEKANHLYPQMAAAEAALESNYGLSELARTANNLFGMKQHSHAVYGTMNLPTREFAGGQWVQTVARWVQYPDWRACFCDRLATLERLSNALPHYKAALDAQDARSYVIQVSESWSTDPGWECTCCAMFPSEAAAAQHAKDYPASPEHAVITRIEGLGRALKVLGIYEAYTAGSANIVM
jgi:flagellum-specific peptidoglycan hydrolase FlgJ